MEGPLARQVEWSDEDRTEVANLLFAGNSLRQVAVQLGVTKAVVVGRVHRDGELQAFVGTVVVMNTRIEHNERFQHPGDAGGVPLMTLGAGDCKWPIGEDTRVPGRHLFCGKPKAGEHTSYCTKHWHVAHPTEQRRLSRHL